SRIARNGRRSLIVFSMGVMKSSRPRMALDLRLFRWRMPRPSLPTSSSVLLMAKRALSRLPLSRARSTKKRVSSSLARPLNLALAVLPRSTLLETSRLLSKSSLTSACPSSRRTLTRVSSLSLVLEH
ncbi:hypothetical protein RSAG8_00367, partial [Rhizoctonia solani AG-8 WAC10335]